MTKTLEKFVLFVYGKKKPGESTLEIPVPTLVITCIISLLLAFGIGTSYLFLKRNQAVEMAESGNIVVKTVADHKNQNSLVLERLKKLLPPDIKRKIQKEYSIEGYETLFSSDTISFEKFKSFAAAGDSAKSARLQNMIVGEITIGNIFYLIYYPKFESLPALNVADSLGYAKPNLENIASEELTEVVKYGLIVSLINKFRQKLGDDYTSPRRILQALGADIQFITFWFAIWALILILLRFSWCLVQKSIIRSGKLKHDQRPILSNKSGAGFKTSVWLFDNEINPHENILADYRNKYGVGLLPVRVIDEAIELKQEDRIPDNVSHYTNDRIDLLEANVQKGEYEIINYLMFAIPNLGFIGTIIGIVMSMSSVSGIIESSAQLDQLNSFEKVGGALGFAFDTTAVSLLWVLILSLILAIVKKMEADMFELLRSKTLVALKYYWKRN